MRQDHEAEVGSIRAQEINNDGVAYNAKLIINNMWH